MIPPSLETTARLLRNSANDDQLLALARRFQDEGSSDVGAICALVESLASSGLVEQFTDRGTDVASTGGPSSLTTLICPLYIVAGGWDVPKLTVPGRPAGGIDVLATIPGYRINPERAEVVAILHEAHYVHMIASSHWTPLDNRLFKLRQQNGLQNVAPLVIASILSKKRALRLTRAAVEIRRGPFGNLGDDSFELSRAVDLFGAVGDRLDMPCRAIVTGDGGPYQPYIGRGEALVALQKIFSQSSATQLDEHLALCKALAEAAIGENVVCTEVETLRAIFASNLAMQGTDYSAFTNRVTAVENEERTAIHSPSAGYLHWDLGALRDAFTRFQGSATASAPFPDECGIMLSVISGRVEAGQKIADARGSTDAVNAFGNAYVVTPTELR